MKLFFLFFFHVGTTIADIKKREQKKYLSVVKKKMETRYRNTGAPTKIEENGQKHNNYSKYTNGNCAKTKSHQNGFKKSTLNGHLLKVKSENIFLFHSHTFCV